MDTKKLRQKILDLAIGGRLVPQDPNDEPASVLLERIREEKKQMVKEGKLKAKDIKNDTIIFKGEDNLHYEKFQDGTVKCIEDEIPFEVPEGWEWCRLKALASPEENAFVDGPFGSNLKTDHYTEEREVRIIQLNNIGDLEWRDNGKKYTTYKHAETLERCKTYPGDIVIAKMMPAGRAIIVPDNEKVFVISSDCVRLRLPNYINAFFVMCAINSSIVNKQVLENVQGIGRTRTSLGKMREVLVPIPGFHEQNLIENMLKKQLNIVDSMDYDIEELKALTVLSKEKILDLAIKGKLVPQNSNDEPASVLLERIRAEKEELIKQGKLKRDKKESIIYKGDDNSYYEKFADGTTNCINDEIPFEIPNSWCFIRLKEVFELLSGRDLPSSDYNDNNIGIPYITGASNFINGNVIINRWTTEPQVITEMGDLLVTCKGTVGELSINSVGQAHIARQVMAIRNLFSLNIYYIQSVISFYVDSLKYQSKGLIPGISRDDILQIILPIPPLDEQDRIIKMQRQISHSISSIEANLS